MCLCICVLDHSLSLGLLNDHDGEEHDDYCDVDGCGSSLDFQMTRCNCVFLDLESKNKKCMMQRQLTSVKNI